MRAVASAQLTTSLKLKTNSTFVAFNFESSVNIGRYELSCSTSYGSTISQMISVDPPSNGSFSRSLFSLQPSQNYQCCVTVYFNIKLLEGINHINHDCVYTTTGPASSTPVICYNSFSMDWLLYFFGGMMLLTLLILVVVSGAWITSCTRRKKTNSVSIHTRYMLKHNV